MTNRSFAVAFCIGLFALAALTAPYRLLHVGELPGFLLAYAVLLGSTETLTAMLLLWRGVTSRERRETTLSFAYAFSAPLVVANILTLPGVAQYHGSFQTAPWLWVCWHVGWGVIVAWFAWQLPRATRLPAVPWIGGTSLALALLVTALGLRDLPPLLRPDGSFTPLLNAAYAVAVATYAFALLGLMRRVRTLATLDIWVGVAVIALALDVVVTAGGGARFSVGFYVARTLGMISGFVVLISLFVALAGVIRRSELLRQYAIVVEHLPVVAFIVDATRSCTYVNRAWTEMTGQPREHALGFGYRDAIHPADLRATLARSLVAGEERQVRVRDRSGAYRHLLVRAVPIALETGIAPGSLIVAVDVEERALAERAVRDSDERLRTFIESVPQIVWTADATGWIDWYNTRWYEYTGQTPEEAAGWGWQAAHHPEDFPAVMERWPHSIATGEPFEMEFRLRRYDGVFQWFLTRIVPQRDADGRILRWYGSNTNIDAQKREAQRSARIAQIMQEAFLPEKLPKLDDVRFDALYMPAESEALVGGDWYDAVTLPDGTVLVSCGDVAGHGVTAAVLAGRYRQSIALTGLEDPDPARILQRVNGIAMLQDTVLTTAVVAVIDVAGRKIRYAIAGHPSPVLAAPGREPRLLRGDGLPLGVLDDARFTTQTAHLDDDALFVAYTDGVIEFAQEPATAETFLCAAAKAISEDRGVANPATLLRETVMGGAPPRDDIAILAVRCYPSEPVAGAAIAPLVRTWRFHSSDALAAHGARRTLAEFLAAHAARDASLYEAELVVGEALANTVEHAPGLVEVAIDWNGRRPVLRVRDTGPGFNGAGAGLPSDLFSEDGRGLFLIRALAEDVRIEPSRGFGTELCCTLPIERAV